MHEINPVFYHSQHIELWDWFAKNPLKFKNDYFEKFNLPEPYMQCYACDAVQKLIGSDDKFISVCDKFCPLDWGENSHCLDSYYGEWNYLKDELYFTSDNKFISRIINLAKIIRDLPLIKNVNKYYKIS